MLPSPSFKKVSTYCTIPTLHLPDRVDSVDTLLTYRTYFSRGGAHTVPIRSWRINHHLHTVPPNAPTFAKQNDVRASNANPSEIKRRGEWREHIHPKIIPLAIRRKLMPSLGNEVPATSSTGDSRSLPNLGSEGLLQTAALGKPCC